MTSSSESISKSSTNSSMRHCSTEFCMKSGTNEEYTRGDTYKLEFIRGSYMHVFLLRIDLAMS